MTDQPTPWNDVELRFDGAMNRSLATDVCVVGGGIAGLTTAYALAREGVSVVLLEADQIGSGETGRTSAHLANALDDRFHRLERLHGREGARLAAESHGAAIDLIETVCRRHDIECDFRRVDGFLFPSVERDDEIHDEFIAAQRAGIDVEVLRSHPLPWLRSGTCLRFPRQAQFHPLRYLRGLARAAREFGVQIFTGTRVEQIINGEPAEIITAQGLRVVAKHVVVATNVPIHDRVRLHPSLEAYRSYVITLTMPHNLAEPMLAWDTAEPYHYLRIIEGDGADLLVVGGEDHKTGQGPEQPDQPYERLESWVRGHVPACGAVVHRWSGQIIEPVDGLALIGHNPGDRDNSYLIAGDSGNGLTHGTLGGLLLCDLIRGRENPWAQLYRPARFRLGAVGEFTRHNVNVIGQYADWVMAADARSVDEIPRGHAGLVRHGLTKWAVHRDQAGVLHACSAICPHLGGLVRWNPNEKTWDCPCHGSRFTIDGQVINGPANTPLAAIPAEQVAGASMLRRPSANG
jgi:glycine/D-amino acid oxidase-like deaminating enzyme/nitrite reductase/ring-hydroxylating ferredoxin subunit